MKNEIIFVSGQRGSGKSFWVKKYLKGLPRFLLYDTLGEYEGTRQTDLAGVIQLCKDADKGFCDIIFDPLDDSLFSLFCRVALAMKNIYIIVEELDQFSTSFKTPIEFQKLIKYGRHYGINLIGISRRPSEVSRLFTSQCTRFVIFNQREPRDVTYFRSIIGEWAEHLPTLQDHSFIDIDFSKGTPSNPICQPV